MAENDAGSKQFNNFHLLSLAWGLNNYQGTTADVWNIQQERLLLVCLRSALVVYTRRLENASTPRNISHNTHKGEWSSLHFNSLFTSGATMFTTEEQTKHKHTHTNNLLMCPCKSTAISTSCRTLSSYVYC